MQFISIISLSTNDWKKCEICYTILNKPIFKLIKISSYLATCFNHDNRRINKTVYSIKITLDYL